MRSGFVRSLSALLVSGLFLISCQPDPDPVRGPFFEFDKVMESKMDEFGIPALSIAIIKDEKLVYVNSYGISNQEDHIKASYEDLYRIASISKPITAVAILKLVEAGSLTLDQKVFGSNGILSNDYGTPPSGSNKDLITVRHLVNHTSGWINSPNDPIFSDVNLTQTQLITDLVSNRMLVSAPGLTYSYLNMGYCILGRVIEKITGKTYQDYVTSNILQPCGISAMQIGANFMFDKHPNEVIYYQGEFNPYAINVRRMDSAGGWIASATDLARFMVKIDRNTMQPDIIPEPLLSEFYFGVTNWYHYGSLPGTSAILRRLNDTFSFVVLTNTRTEGNYNLILDALNDEVIEQITSISIWPAEDLF